jgi:hypothetical protein
MDIRKASAPFEKPNCFAGIDKERTDIAEAFPDAALDWDRMNRGVACPEPLQTESLM